MMEKTYCGRRGMIAVAAAVMVAGFAVPRRALADQSAVAPIQRLVDGLLTVMKAGNGTPFPQRFDMLAPVIDGSFNLMAIMQESVGPAWENLPQEQQKALIQAFRRYTVASYVNSFDKFEGQRFDVSPETRAVGANEQVVHTRIIPKSGDGHDLDYVMRQGNEGWQAVDVLADGSVSRVAVQRSDFRRLLARGGPQALAESLRTKSADLSNGMS